MTGGGFRNQGPIKEVVGRTKREFARLVRVVSRPRLPEMRGLNIEAISRLIYERWRRRRPSELVSWHRRVHADVLETLAKTPSEFFGRRERSREWPLDFDGHSAAHRMKDIEAALKGAPAVRKRRTGA